MFEDEKNQEKIKKKLKNAWQWSVETEKSKG